MVPRACNSFTREAEAEGSRAQGQLGQHSETLILKTKGKEKSVIQTSLRKLVMIAFQISITQLQPKLELEYRIILNQLSRGAKLQE